VYFGLSARLIDRRDRSLSIDAGTVLRSGRYLIPKRLSDIRRQFFQGIYRFGCARHYIPSPMRTAGLPEAFPPR
jgi:hypothetical protein